MSLCLELLGSGAWAASYGIVALSPDAVRTVTIAADADRAGQRAAAKAARRWRAEGRSVHIATPDVPGQDFNDVLLARLRDAAEVEHA